MRKQFDIDLLKFEQSQTIAEHIVSILQYIRFGSIEIVVH
jgi:hypothetical protein